MPERSHDWSDGEGIADLVDCSEPRSDIRDVPGSREAEDVVEKLLCGLDPVVGNKEPQEVDVSGPELKLFWVKSAASTSRYLQELANTIEVLLDSIVVDNTVIDTRFLVGETLHNLRFSLSVAITSRDETLGAGAMSVAAVGGDEGG